MVNRLLDGGEFVLEFATEQLQVVLSCNRVESCTNRLGGFDLAPHIHHRVRLLVHRQISLLREQHHIASDFGADGGVKEDTERANKRLQHMSPFEADDQFLRDGLEHFLGSTKQ